MFRLPQSEASSPERSCVPVERVDSEVEGLALLPPFPRVQSLRAGREAEGDTSDLAILRHSDIATTLGFYVETSEAESRDALDKLTALMG